MGSYYWYTSNDGIKYFMRRENNSFEHVFRFQLLMLAPFIFIWQNMMHVRIHICINLHWKSPIMWEITAHKTRIWWMMNDDRLQFTSWNPFLIISIKSFINDLSFLMLSHYCIADCCQTWKIQLPFILSNHKTININEISIIAMNY